MPMEANWFASTERGKQPTFLKRYHQTVESENTTQPTRMKPHGGAFGCGDVTVEQTTQEYRFYGLRYSFVCFTD